MAQTTSLEWRLAVIMAERRIRTVTELRRMLLEIDFDISSAQLGRVVNEMPNRISTDLLLALVSVLKCGVGDLIRVTSEPVIRKVQPSNDESLAEPKPRRRRAPAELPSEVDESVTGPKLTALPRR